MKKLSAIFMIASLMLMFSYSYADKGFKTPPVDQNRSIVFGYLEHDDCFYDTQKGGDRVLDVMFKFIGGAQVIRIFSPGKYEGKEKAETQVVEGKVNTNINQITFGCIPEDNKIKYKLIKMSSGYLFYFLNVPLGEWRLLAFHIGSLKGNLYKAESTPVYDDFIGLSYSAGYNVILNDPLKVKITNSGVYFAGSNHYSTESDLNFHDEKKSEFHRSHTGKELSQPSEKELLQELLKLSSGSKWEALIKQRIAEIEK